MPKIITSNRVRIVPEIYQDALKQVSCRSEDCNLSCISWRFHIMACFYSNYLLCKISEGIINLCKVFCLFFQKRYGPTTLKWSHQQWNANALRIFCHGVMFTCYTVHNVNYVSEQWRKKWQSDWITSHEHSLNDRSRVNYSGYVNDCASNTDTIWHVRIKCTQPRFVSYNKLYTTNNVLHRNFLPSSNAIIAAILLHL